MTVVVDASMIAAWLLPDERTEATDVVLQGLRGTVCSAPSILHHEVRNILLVSERRGRISTTKTSELLSRFAAIAIEDRGPGNDGAIIRLARAHKLTAYDSAYLAIALDTGAPLATLDRALAKAALACGVALLGPLAP